MIPYGHQFIDKKDIKSVVDVLKSDWLTQGPKVLEFEEALANYCGAKYAVACSNGTVALHLAYLVAGLKKGDEVITTPNTFAATANMLLAVSAKPIFCDVRLDTYNIDETKIETLITGKTRAIVPVHFSGQSCEMAAIRKIAKKRGLLAIEDACHALGAKYKNSKIGGCQYSDMAVFSFHPVKSITTGEGGAILTNNKKYYEKLKLLRNHGIYKDKNGKNVMTELGYNYRLTDIQAALGISQMKKLDSFIKKRRQVVEWYKKELKEIDEIILPQELEDNYSSWHIFVIRIVNFADRDKLANFLKNNSVGVNFHYPAVCSHPYYQQKSYNNINLNNEEIYQKSCLTLPCFPGLTKKQIQFIASLIKKYFIVKAKKIIDAFNDHQKILGKRIYLRQLSLADASQKYCNWLNDGEVNKYLETRRSTIGDLRQYIAKQLADPNSFFVGIFDKINGKHIGNIKLGPIDWMKKKAIFGILIGNKDYWGKDIGAEATKLIINFAFNFLELKEIELGVIKENKRARKAFARSGFKVIRIEKKSMDHGKIVYDKIIMKIKKLK